MINHWLLNAAAEFGVLLTCIFPEAGRGLNVKPVPISDSEQYSRGLLELFDSAQIAFSSKVPGDDPQTRNGVAQILDRFRALSKQDSVFRGELGLLPTHRE